jgi:hypothetical protein
MRNLPYFRKMFLGLIHIDKTKHTYMPSQTVMEKMTPEKCGLVVPCRVPV